MMATHAANMDFTNLSHEELQLKMGEVVATHGVKFKGFTTMQLTPGVIRAVESLNRNRGKSLPYSWDHIKDGYKGAFYKYDAGETPVMKAGQVKDYLAMLYCLILHEC